MWSNKYIGIPFKEKGRDFDGVDCWGLTRLIYKNEFNIDLPSFSEDYEISDTQRLADLIAQYKEGWNKLDKPKEGAGVLFRVLGSEVHMGVAISETHFIHVRENYDSAIEAFDSTGWKNRIIGFYEYKEQTSATLNAAPHPLRTERFTAPIAAGTTLAKLAEWIQENYKIDPALKTKITIILNGRVIPEVAWGYTVLQESDSVEYRAVPRGDAVRLVLMVAVVVFAPQIALALGPTLGIAAGSIGMTMLTAGISMLGMALINVIAPIRPPAAPADPGSANQQLMLTGAGNKANQYGAIPVVLGRVRFTPPLGATNFLTYEYGTDSYLNMLLVWGYGPLYIDSSTLKIGDTYLSDYSNYSIVTLDRITEPSADTLNYFNSIYGRDIDQVYSGVNLSAPGNPEAGWAYGPWVNVTSNNPATRLSVAIHFPEGIRRVITQGDGAGNSQAVGVQFEINYRDSGGGWYGAGITTVGGDVPIKDAFTYTWAIDLPYRFTTPEVRIRRLTGDNAEDNPNFHYYFSSIFHTATFTNNGSPAIDPVNAKIAKTAIRIKASDQLNNQIEGINAIVQTYCYVYSGTPGYWYMAPSSNPAALFRYVLQHPANPQRVLDSDISTKINLAALEYWYTYCNAHGFEFNSVMGEAKSVLDTLRDICAAGRASPAMVDGKWTVTIDEPKSVVVQHFTPHNSWGFEGTKALPKYPDGLRVTYYDQDQGFQQAEVIVYAAGKSAGNAALFEKIELPGVTKKSLVIDHARWHMAQAKLRPETYTLNTDIEYLVCNRGDRVKVTHDVPMWGLGSGRIKNRLSDYLLELDETLPIKAGTNYTIRVRSSTGASVERSIQTSYTATLAKRSANIVTITLSEPHPFQVGNALTVNLTTGSQFNVTAAQIVAVTQYSVSYQLAGTSLANMTVIGTVSFADSYVTTIKTTASTTTTEANAGDLFLFGEYQQEAQDLIILSIEPTTNKSARLTLIDYGVTPTYDIFSGYTSLTEFTVFETQITLPPKLVINTFGTLVPAITKLVSDESVMVKIAPGVFDYRLQVSYVNPDTLPINTASVEFQVDYAAATTNYGTRSLSVPFNAGSISIKDVDEGSTYKVRCRYVGSDGRTGNWTSWVTNTIVGRTSPPATVSGLSVLVNANTGKLELDWTPNQELDLAGYEVRTSDTGWGTSGFLYKGAETSVNLDITSLGSLNYYVKAFDTSGNYSLVAANTATIISVPNAPTGIGYEYSIQSATGTTARIYWNTAAVANLATSYYEIKIYKSSGTVTINSYTTEYLTLVTWTTDTIVEVRTVDIKGNKSSPATLTMIKAAPSTPTGGTVSVKDSSLILDWNDAVAGSLPIAGYEIRTTTAGWGTSGFVTRVTGSIASIDTGISVGSNTWYIKSYDTSGQYSAAYLTISYTVAIPSPPSNLSIAYYDTNTSGAIATLSWTAPAITTFGIDKYELTLTKYPGPTVTVTTVSATSIQLPVDWRTSLSVQIRSIDISGSISNSVTASFNKTLPSSPASFSTVASVSGGITISWPAATKGTLPIDGYELRSENINPGAPNFVYRGSSNSVSIPSVVLGTNTWYLWAFDTDGQYSATPLTVTFTATAPSPVTGLSMTFNNSSTTSSTAIFSWNKPLSSMFSIDRYEVTLSYTTPSNTTLTTSRYSNTWEVPANWVGNATLTVTVYDVVGNASAVTSSTFSKLVPNTPGACTVTVSGTGLDIDWPDNIVTSLPVSQYEIRTSDSGWGTPGYVWKGSGSRASINLGQGTGTLTWYLKAIDTSGQYSTTSRSIAYTVTAPVNPTVYPAEFADTSLTAATVTLSWDPVVPQFGLSGYEVSYTGSVDVVNSTTFTVPANWLGDRVFTVKTIDGLQNKSSGVNITATKLAPNPVTDFRAQVIDNNVLLYWTLPAKTTLPISHVYIKRGATWNTATVIGEKAGTFTSLNELSGGVFTYWIAVVDTDNNMSTPVSIGATVSQPPDFIFNAQYTSTFTGTLSNAIVDSGRVVLPVNTTETFTQHFTNNAWTKPSDQVTAGFPVFIQPGLTTGYYEEIFDYGTTLGGSQITTTISGSTVAGNPTVAYVTSVSLDGITYTSYPGGSSVFANNFRYVKVRITVSQASAGDMYSINSLVVRLDAKQKNDSGSVSAVSSDTNGTIVNFTQEFIDVASITLTPQGTTPLTAVFDFLDTVLAGTYSVTSNIATINVTGHSLQVGQKVRLSFTSGGGINGVYTVASVINANSYTVAMTTANTSGNVSSYPNSLRVYLFDQSGTRVSGNVSWASRGY